LKKPAQAVYRGQVAVAAEILAAEAVQLKVGRIDDRGWVYVNGKLAGESHDWASSPSFDIQPFLHAGTNMIAIAIINDDGSGGLGNGVAVRVFKKSESPQWQRSVFNGLAQVLVQSSGKPGELRLTATANGITPAAMTVEAR